MWPLGCFASLAMTGTELARLFLGVALRRNGMTLKKLFLNDARHLPFAALRMTMKSVFAIASTPA
jgi:hypothetical protein